MNSSFCKRKKIWGKTGGGWDASAQFFPVKESGLFHRTRKDIAYHECFEKRGGLGFCQEEAGRNRAEGERGVGGYDLGRFFSAL